ncbi:hypothetical protein Tco_0514750 [Tanacetum coccineum]
MMANLSEDIQCVSSDTRPPMLDRSDFESWQQRIRLYCLGKANGENILKSIDEGPFKMGKFRETLAEGAESAHHLGLERDRVFADLTPEEKERFVTIIKLNRGLKTSTYDQLYAYMKQHEALSNENKMMLERYNRHAIDPLAFVSNVSPQQYPTQSSAIPQSTYENEFVLYEGQLLFIAGGQTNTLDDDVDEALVQDLALNKDNVFQADQCDVFDSNVYEAPTAQTMFMANISSADPIYNEAGPSYDSDILFEYVKDNTVQVEQSNVSYVPNDALMMIINDMPEQDAQCVSTNEQYRVVNESLTTELAKYKEQVELYEKRARFELTEREQKIDEQLRIIISDRNYKEEYLKKELHSVKMQLNSTINHNKSMIEEVTTLKKDFKQKENKYLKDCLDMNALKDKIEDKLFKQDQSLQTVHMLCKPKPYYDEKKKTNHAPAVVHDSEDALELADITRKRMLEKVKSPLCVEKRVNIAPPDYSK